MMKLLLLAMATISISNQASSLTFKLQDQHKTYFDIQIDDKTGNVDSLIITPKNQSSIDFTKKSKVLSTEQAFKSEGYKKVDAVPYSILVKDCPMAPTECLINPEHLTYFTYLPKKDFFGNIKKELQSYYYMYTR